MDKGLRSRSALPSDEVEEEEEGKRRGKGRAPLLVQWRTALAAFRATSTSPCSLPLVSPGRAKTTNSREYCVCNHI